MHLPIRKLSFHVIILAQIIIIVSGQTDKCSVQSLLEDLPSDYENNDICIDGGSNIVAEVNSEVVVDKLLANNTTANVTKINCLTDKLYRSVEIVNATRLMELLILEPGPTNRTRTEKESRQLPGTCVLVLFYARWCIFSSQAAPHFNALPRYFPHVKAVAIDAAKHQSFKVQYGIVGLPTLIFVHNGKPVARFNATVYTLGAFATFIKQLTTLQLNDYLYLKMGDFNGPVIGTPSNETDYCLVLSWIFIAVCSLYFTSKSRWWQQFIEVVQNTWRESNAQHEHVD